MADPAANVAVQNETNRVRRLWDRMAPQYDPQMSLWERLLFGGGREWVCSQADGEVLEIAIGTGRNLPHYPKNAQLTGIDNSPAMLEFARTRAKELNREADLRVEDAQHLEFTDASFDTVISTLSLCSIPDDAKAVAEVWRVLRPGGRFVLLEHVASPLIFVRAAQRVVDWFTVRLQGDHQVRQPLERLKAQGFLIERLERLKLGIVQRIVARKPTR
ncbi:MAG: class I SAM-dependent methyltransferase [bacterium]